MVHLEDSKSLSEYPSRTPGELTKLIVYPSGTPRGLNKLIGFPSGTPRGLNKLKDTKGLFNIYEILC